MGGGTPRDEGLLQPNRVRKNPPYPVSAPVSQISPRDLEEHGVMARSGAFMWFLLRTEAILRPRPLLLLLRDKVAYQRWTERSKMSPSCPGALRPLGLPSWLQTHRDLTRSRCALVAAEALTQPSAPTPPLK